MYNILLCIIIVIIMVILKINRKNGRIAMFGMRISLILLLANNK